MILGCILAFGAISCKQQAAPAALRCRIDALEDTEKSKMVAYTYLVPDSWSSHHSMSWVSEDSFAASLAVTTPDKRYSVDQLEPLLVTYSEPKDGVQSGIHIVHATDFLHAAIQQLKRQFGVENIKLADELNEPLRDSTAPEKGDGRTCVRESGYLKVNFQVSGQEEVAELATTVTGYNLQSASAASAMGSYQVGPTTMIVMPAKRDPQRLQEVQLIVSSMNATFQFSEYLRKQSHEPVDTASTPQNKLPLDKEFWLLRSMRGYCAEMSSKDASTHRFCGLFSPPEPYRAKDGSVIRLPTLYGHVWTDGEGDFVFSDSAAAGASGPGGNWLELHKG